MTTPHRDELGRFATKPNGGGANFSTSEPYPETRDVLMKHSTSGPSTAPTMTGSQPDIAFPKIDDEALNMVMAGRQGLDIAGGAHSASNNIAHRAMGYTSGESAGGVADNLSARFTPHPPVAPQAPEAPALDDDEHQGDSGIGGGGCPMASSQVVAGNRPHGTVAAYVAGGCRCDECRSEHSAYTTDLRRHHRKYGLIVPGWRDRIRKEMRGND